MALNLSALLGQLNNQSRVTQTPADIINKPLANGQTADNSGIALLKNMLAGDTFTGKIMNVNDGTALIMLNDGSNVSARLSGNSNINIGQNMTFLVEQNTSDNISLKPLGTTGQEAVLIDKALEAANLTPTDSNINIVSELLDMNMPVDAKTLNDMVRYSAQFPDANLNTIANLIRLDMPVTADNIAQFDAYRSLEHTISGNFDAIGNELNEVFTNIIGNDESNTPVTGQALDFINTLYSADESGGDTANISSRLLSDMLSDNEYSTLNEIFSGVQTSESTESTESSIAAKLNNGTATVKGVLSALLEGKADVLKEKPQLKEALSELTPKLINQMIDETLKVTPENIAKQDGIKNYYKRMKSILEKSGEKLNDEGFSNVNKEMNQVKANIDFMNDLNKNMTYFQMPVHFKDSNGDGELYVFTNKRALANNTDNVSALLHLDMDNLGPMDIYVKMTGKNVSTNFCLETEELLDFVYSNIDKLNKRLEQLGYSTTFNMSVSEKDSAFDFVNDFVEKDIPSKATSQFVFDIKA